MLASHHRLFWAQPWWLCRTDAVSGWAAGWGGDITLGKEEAGQTGWPGGQALALSLESVPQPRSGSWGQRTQEGRAPAALSGVGACTQCHWLWAVGILSPCGGQVVCSSASWPRLQLLPVSPGDAQGGDCAQWDMWCGQEAAQL